MFDTHVQELKYKVLREVATLAYEDNLKKGILDIPQKIITGNDSPMRCCIYKERAIVSERVKIAMGGDPKNDNIVEVLNIACDECPITQIKVGEACRGCIAHRCVLTCPKKAIKIVNHHAEIDQEKCISCGKCLNVCPYSAITKSLRPCERACKVGAITMDVDKKAHIDNNKCISCGACVYQCPFGAVMDKSFILDAIDILKASENNTKYEVYAVVAPSIAGQFAAPMAQVVTGLKRLGFFNVVEAALGADMVAYKEAKELADKGFLTSSCCPAFVDYARKKYPMLKEHISHNLSPMAEIAKHIKKSNPTAKVIFIGPCTAKKAERREERVAPLVDVVLTFEELMSLFDSREISLCELPESTLNNASYYGRIFARSGGLLDAVSQALKEREIGSDSFELKGLACNGIEECNIALLKASKGVLEHNFIEGMACVSGCIGGPACLTHGVKEKSAIDKYGHEALEKTITDAIRVLDL